MLEIVNAVAWLLVSFTADVALVVPTVWETKDRLVGLNVTGAGAETLWLCGRIG